MAYQSMRRKSPVKAEAGQVRASGRSVPGIGVRGFSNSALCDMMELAGSGSSFGLDAAASGSAPSPGTAAVQMKRPGEGEPGGTAGRDCLSAIRGRLERESGIRLDDVRVYLNSRKPEAMGALAYTRGSDIFLGPGQEKLLGHEMTHVVQQKQGLVRPTGTVNGVPVNTSPALENAADHMSVGAPAAPVSAPSAAAMPAGGVVQGFFWKKKKNAADSDKQNLAKLKPASNGHKLDIEAMNFGKKSYKNDAEYQKIQYLMELYNSIDENENAQAKNAVDIQLMNAAMDYIEKASGGEKEQHAGRTARLEEMLYQLSMKGGTAERADENAEKLRQSNRESTESQGLKDSADKTLQHLKGVYADKSPYSRTMQMITAGVLADQNAGGAEAPEYSPSARKSAADLVIHPGSTGYGDKHHYMVHSRAGTDINDSAGTTLHELTHVASGEVYKNSSGMLTVGEDATDQEIADKYKRRVKTVAELNDTLNKGRYGVKRVSESQKGFTKNAKDFFRSKLEYAAMNNVARGANAQEKQMYMDVVTPYAKKQKDYDEFTYIGAMRCNEIWKKTLGQYLNIDDENVQNYLKGKGPKPESVPQDFNISPEEQTKFNTQSEMIGKMRRYDDLIADTSQNDPETLQRLGEINKHNESYNAMPGRKTGANALMEYDTVMNQMLFQYENAGESGQKKDRSSQFYRQLRNAALRAHLERREHKLKHQGA